MQYKFTLIIFCTLLLSASTGTFKSENKEITKYYVHVPAKDADRKGFYISSIEITNKQYRNFLNDLKVKGETDELRRTMVDTSKWKGVLTYNEPYIQKYFQNPAYDSYPVVNISKEGAFLYCEWLTEKYNSSAKVKVHFVLPSEEQWIRAAQGGDTLAVYPWKGTSLTYDQKGKWHGNNMCNYKVQKAIYPGVNNKTADITAPAISYLPNAYGIYNMAGNVAELLSDKNYTKGGSWNSPADKLTIASKEEYAAVPNYKPYVGFRPVMLTSDGK